MFIEVVKSKLHKVTVTDANLQYVGSITIDEALLEAANMIENEKVQIVNINNGERFDTYIIKGERDSGTVSYTHLIFIRPIKDLSINSILLKEFSRSCRAVNIIPFFDQHPGRIQ